MISSLFSLLAFAGDPEASPPRARISDSFPNPELTNQFGETFRFKRDFVDGKRALIINTMYTTCRGSCPGTSAQLEALRRSLSPIFGKRMAILSLTLEPRIDTPAVLRSYARSFGADRPDPEQMDWHFVRTKDSELDPLRRSLGFFDLDPRIDGDITQHASLLLVGNPRTDRWCMVPSELRRAVLIDTVRRTAGFTFHQRYGIEPPAPK